MFKSLFLALLALVAVSTVGGREITYPSNTSPVVDITAAPYFADPTGQQDIADALEAAVADRYMHGEGYTTVPFIYFPNGVYRVSRPIVVEDVTEAGQWIMLQGQTREGVVIRLDDNAPDFQDAENPRAVISFFEGEWTNNAFQMIFENFTVEVGEGNPGAVGVRFHGNNNARMENVTIRSLDPAGVGAIGLDLAKSISAPGIIKRVLVEGFDAGVTLDNTITGAQAWMIDQLTIRDQNVVGVRSHRKAVQLIDFHSTNTVPAVEGLFVDGMFTIINSVMTTPDGQLVEGEAVRLRGDFAYLRNVEAHGYTNLLDDDGVIVEATGEGQAYQNGPVYSLWDDVRQTPLALPIEAIPDTPETDPETWVTVDPTAQGDDTEAIQAALLSGAETVFLIPGTFQVSDTLFIGPKVRHLHGNYAIIRWDNSPMFGTGLPSFVLGPTEHDTVFLERLSTTWIQNGNEYFLHNYSDADLVMRDIFWVGGGVYRNEPRGGKLFVENVHNVPGGQVFRSDLPTWIITNQDTWGRQFNPEMALPMLTVDGGRFWIMSFKFGEVQGPLVYARNQAQVEFLGGYMNVTHGVDMEPFDTSIIDVEEAQVTLRFIERAGERYGPPYWNFRHRNVAREVRNGEERWLPTTADEIIHRDSISRNGPGRAGAMVPLYSSAYDVANYPGNTVPSVVASASPSATISEGILLYAEATDADGPAMVPSIHWRTASGPGRVSFEQASAGVTRAYASQAGVYTFVATSSDRLVRADSEPVSVEVKPESLVYHFDRLGMQRLADVPPRDGIGDTRLASILLQAGDV